MTEADWRTGAQPDLLYWHLLKTQPSARKLRLHIVAFCRAVPAMVAHREARAVLDCTERFVDGLVSNEEFEAAIAHAHGACRDAFAQFSGHGSTSFSENYAMSRPEVYLPNLAEL